MQKLPFLLVQCDIFYRDKCVALAQHTLTEFITEMRAVSIQQFIKYLLCVHSVKSTLFTTCVGRKISSTI